jgi:hypothetical protein
MSAFVCLSGNLLYLNDLNDLHPVDMDPSKGGIP